MSARNLRNANEWIVLSVRISRPRNTDTFHVMVEGHGEDRDWVTYRDTWASPTRLVLQELDTVREILNQVLGGLVLERWGGELELDLVDVVEQSSLREHPMD